MAAGDMPFAADKVADLETFDILADLDDFPDIFMPGGQADRNRMLRPFVPVINMHVRAADRRLADFDLHVVFAAFRDRHLFQR